MPVSAARVLRAVAGEDQTDADLLGRFIDRRDEEAFALLVRRHGAMVYGVCRRMLPEPDAEDAFQAVFLVLAQKARTAAPREVANWLYGVARRAALLSRRSIARRRERTGEMPDRPAPEPPPPSALRAALDEELSRLPDRYRTVVVLCDLDGRTRREAAAILGWPEGTVAGRLVRAREVLAKRMARHAPSVSLVTVLAGTASARVPEAFTAAATIPFEVAALKQEILSVMLRGALMKTAAAVALLGCTVFGLALSAGQTPGPEKPVVPVAAEPPVKPAKSDEVIWGKEVDGLQAGVVATTRVYRPSETIKMEVRLRNVGKADITIKYGNLREHPPHFTNADGVQMTVAMPPRLGVIVIPTEHVMKPGETLSLYKPEVAVENEDRARLDGELLVSAPTIYVGPGKYRFAFGGMIHSHPTLTTGDVAFEVKDRVAWGKEAGGLQAGIVGPGSVRIGEKARFVVKLRNVSQETIKVSAWPLWMTYPGVVDARGDRVRTTVAPTPLFSVSPKNLTLKPGETVDVGRSDLIVAEPDQKVAVPDGVVDLCAIHVKPGMHKTACIGFLKENHLLATGAVEFEVKAAREGVTAWGQELGGLQAGLTIAEKRAYSHGETVTLVVRVRNVSKEAVKFGYIRQYLDENPPGVMGADGKVIPQAGPSVEGLRHVPVEVSLDPGKEIVLESRIHGASGLPYELRPAGGGGKPATRDHPLKVGTGKVTLRYERVFGNSSIGSLKIDPNIAELATGKLELEVTDAEQKEKGSVHLPTHGGGMRELKGKELEAYQTTNAWLAELLKEASSIKVGSTYADVTKHFRTDGGVTPVGKSRFVMILCPYLKIDIEFEQARGDALAPTAKVTRVSRPYFEPEFED